MSTKELLDRIEKFADFQIRAKAIRYPEYIRGINAAGKNLKDEVRKLRELHASDVRFSNTDSTNVSPEGES